MHLSKGKREKNKNKQSRSKISLKSYISANLSYITAHRQRSKQLLIASKGKLPNRNRAANNKALSSLLVSTRSSCNNEAVRREKQNLPNAPSEPLMSTKKQSKAATAKSPPRIYDNSEKCQKDKRWMHELAQSYAADVFAAEVATDAREANFGLHHGLSQPPMAGCCQKFVQQLINMGYDEAEAQNALTASLNNPERAISYLIEGIPSVTNIVPNQQPQPPSNFYNPLAFLSSLPSFRHMRYLVQERPDLLDKILTKIGNISPQLLEMINNNREEFLKLINDRSHEVSHLKVNCEDYEDHRTMLNDNKAIERLVRLGFTPAIALQTYMACDRNEDLATECLCHYLNN